MSRTLRATCFLVPCDGAVLTQAVPLAAAGAIYPVAFAAIVAMLGGREPLRRAIAFLAGGAIISLVAFAIIVVILSTLRFTPHHHPAVSAAIKIGLGILLLLLAARTLLRRRRRDASVTAPEQPHPEDTGSTRRAFISGVIVYFPGVFLVASAKAVADAHAGFAPTAATSVLCVVVLLLIVEVPIVAFAVAPERVQPPLERITAMAKRHSAEVVLAIELVGGGYLLIAGLVAL
jgi:hypothetical protein